MTVLRTTDLETLSVTISITLDGGGLGRLNDSSFGYGIVGVCVALALD